MNGKNLQFLRLDRTKHNQKHSSINLARTWRQTAESIVNAPQTPAVVALIISAVADPTSSRLPAGRSQRPNMFSRRSMRETIGSPGAVVRRFLWGCWGKVLGKPIRQFFR
jgi:hypothetical protein